MICGFLNNSVVSAEEYLIAYGLRTGSHVDVNCGLLNMSIKFDDKEIYAFILDVANGSLSIQLVLPLKDKFDDMTNVYKNSYIRNLINSKDFLNRFDQEFVNHIKPTIVHTEDYTTTDKLWLLSHEEISKQADFLRTNDNCQPFDLFEHTDLRSYSQALLKLNKQQCYGWRLRSATPYTTYKSLSRFVGFVTDGGDVYNTHAFHTDYGALLPACTICCQSCV